MSICPPSVGTRDQEFQKLDTLDRIGDLGAFLQILQDDQIAIGGVFVRDEREPYWGGFGYDEAGVEGWIGVERLPCGADDVAASLGGVGGYGCQEPCWLMVLLLW